ncbi:P-loop NTPase fold protein [Lysobacter enzymogenes]|uniref:KAP family P-loop NTPase fold protein n=1 Tax=Lysobacter enzymogenes TaxID=69 RepID=UPI00384BCF58
MRNDHPTLEDKLRRSALVKAKAARIMKCQPAQAFGVHGDWGAGKTSFLRQVRYHLDGSNEGCMDTPGQELEGDAYKGRVVTIWFEAWRYQHETSPAIALLQEIRRQFSVWAKVKGKAKKLGEVTVRSVLNGLDDAAKLLKLDALPLNPKGIQEIGEGWEKEHLEHRLGVDSIQAFLEASVSVILKSLAGPGARLVVFIDDLDRCTAKSAFRLLESLKIYFGLTNCVFVIGMNQQLVVDAVASCMPLDYLPHDPSLKEAAARIRAEAYLEKVCTDIERLTPPYDVAGVFCQWLENGALAVVVRVSLNDGNGGKIRCLPPNPRRLKALANLLDRWWPALDTLVMDRVDKARAIIIIAYVYQFHSELFQRWQFNPAFYTHLQNWAAKAWPSWEGRPGWPAYFSSLKLPEEMVDVGAGQGAVPQIEAQSNYPDPYAADMFWVAPMIRAAGLNEQTMEAVMNALLSSPE